MTGGTNVGGPKEDSWRWQIREPITRTLDEQAFGRLLDRKPDLMFAIFVEHRSQPCHAGSPTRHRHAVPGRPGGAATPDVFTVTYAPT